MEGTEAMNSGVTVIGAEAPSAYHVAPRAENPTQIAAGSPPGMGPSTANIGLSGSAEKKKRGRPRKYGPDGAVARTLSPMPISSSAPPSGDFSSGKRGKSRLTGYESKPSKKTGSSDNLGNNSFLSFA